MQIIQSRRDFLASLSAAGAAGLLGARRSLADEGPPETTTVRLAKDPGICVAPQYIAEELLRAEGFTDIRYVAGPGGVLGQAVVARGEIDFALTFAAIGRLAAMDAGVPITVLAGVHSGCFELFAHEPIRTISDLKGKRVGIDASGSSHAPVSRDHGGLRRARSRRGHRLGRCSRTGSAHGAVRRRQGRCVSRLPARAAGAARPQDRSRDPQHGHGQAVVAVFLLHGGRQHGVRPRLSGRHQALPAGHPQGHRPLRGRAGAGRTTAGRCAGSPSATTTRSRR